MSYRENLFLWIIFAAPLGIFLGFVCAPPDVVAQLFGAFVGVVIFTAGTCILFLAFIRAS